MVNTWRVDNCVGLTSRAKDMAVYNLAGGEILHLSWVGHRFSGR